MTGNAPRRGIHMTVAVFHVMFPKYSTPPYEEA